MLSTQRLELSRANRAGIRRMATKRSREEGAKGRDDLSSEFTAGYTKSEGNWFSETNVFFFAGLTSQVTAAALWRISSCNHMLCKAENRKDTMTSEGSTKCAHPPCFCVPPVGEKYCSQTCQEAGSEEVEIACDCGHPACTV